MITFRMSEASFHFNYLIDTSSNNQKYLPLGSGDFVVVSGSGDFVVVSSEEPPLQHSITPRLRIKTKIIELKKSFGSL